jgi:hypothetical protein
MRQSWTDDRLDELSHRMDERFDQIEGEMKSQGRELRGEIEAQRQELRQEMAGMEARLRAQASEHFVRTGEEFGRVHDDKQQLLVEMQALQRTIIQIGWTGAITLIAAVVAALVAQLF